MIKVLSIGLGELKKEVQAAKKTVQDEVDAELQAASMRYVQLAKRDLASQGGDTGALLGSIGYEKTSVFNYTVFARIFYAAFIEFGTKDGYTPQPGTEEYASQFKGERGNSSVKLIDAIKAWVLRKGIAEGKDADRAAFAIARSIYKNGIKPKPFFFKQIPIIKNQITKNVRKVLDGI